MVQPRGVKPVSCPVGSGITDDYLYDLSGHFITQVSGQGSWVRGEIYAGGQHIATYENDLSTPTTFFTHADHLGTERVETGVSGASCETTTSLPFGDGLNTSGSCDPTALRFTGKQRDFETNLDNFGARYNSSSLGRFMSPDPLGGHQEDPQSLNKYAYVRDNPLNLTDPTGLDFWLGCDKASASCGHVDGTDALVQGTTDKKGNFTATVVTSDSIRDGDNQATVDQNGVQITTGGKTSNGIYFDNPNSITTDSNGNTVDHNPIDLMGSGALKDFSFNINGNCGGTCLASGSFSFGGSPQEARDLLKQRGGWDYGFWDGLDSGAFGHHPQTDQFRFGTGPSSHLSVPWDYSVSGVGGGPAVAPNPKATTPLTGDFHVDRTVGSSHFFCANFGLGCKQ